MSTECGQVIVLGDLHGDTAWATEVIRAIPELLPEPPILIIQVGDFGAWAGPGGAAYLDGLHAALEEVDAHLWFLLGNHEDYDFVRTRATNEPERQVFWGDRIHLLQTGTRWRWNGLTWLVAGGAVSVDRALRTPGRDWWPQEQLTDLQVHAMIKDGPADVLLCHDRPADAPISLPPWPREWDLADYALAEAHRERMQRLVAGVRPELIVHGHYHMPGVLTVPMKHGDVKVISLGMNGQVGNLLHLDTETLDATISIGANMVPC